MGRYETACRSTSPTGTPFPRRRLRPTNIDLATMEGANESARAAVNALLHESGSSAAPARTWTLYQPPELEAFKLADKTRYDMGLPNIFDIP